MIPPCDRGRISAWGPKRAKSVHGVIYLAMGHPLKYVMLEIPAFARYFPMQYGANTWSWGTGGCPVWTKRVSAARVIATNPAAAAYPTVNATASPGAGGNLQAQI